MVHQSLVDFLGGWFRSGLGFETGVYKRAKPTKKDTKMWMNEIYSTKREPNESKNNNQRNELNNIENII
jgi:hypothetical protein